MSDAFCRSGFRSLGFASRFCSVIFLGLETLKLVADFTDRGDVGCDTPGARALAGLALHGHIGQE